MKFKSWENRPKINPVLTNCMQSVTLIRSWSTMKMSWYDLPAMFTLHTITESKVTHFCRTFELLCCAVLGHAVVSDSATLWAVAFQAPLSMGFSRREYWSGLAFSSPGDLPEPAGIVSSGSSALAGRFFTTVSTLLNYMLFYLFRPKFYFPVFQNPPN